MVSYKIRCQPTSKADFMRVQDPKHVTSAPSQANIDSRGHGGFVASRHDAPAYWFYGTLWVVLADVHQTGGSCTVMEQWMRGGIGPASHVHNVDEWFFVLEGSMDMQVDGRDVTGKAGDSIWIRAAPTTGSRRPVKALTSSTAMRREGSSRSSSAWPRRQPAASSRPMTSLCRAKTF
jgi:mannose-6-phosphate isomerase-like protein (cupin superfamily)